MSTRDKLLAEIEAFLLRQDMPPTTFGMAAIGDFNLLHRLRSGLDIRTGSMDRIVQYMQSVEGNGHGAVRRGKARSERAAAYR